MATLAEASLSELDTRVLERFVPALREQLGEALDSVWLYGSRARGDNPHEESDVDLLVLVRGSADDLSTQINELKWKVALDADGVPPRYSVYVRDRAWLEDRRRIRSFFMQEVDRDKIVLFGDP